MFILNFVLNECLNVYLTLGKDTHSFLQDNYINGIRNIYDQYL